MSKITHLVGFELTPEQLEKAAPLIQEIAARSERGECIACIGQLITYTDGTASAGFGLIPFEDFEKVKEILEEDETPDGR